MLYSSHVSVSPDLLERTERRLSVILSQHYRYTEPLFAALERDGVFLGNGCFAVAVAGTDVPILPEQEAEALAHSLSALCRTILHTPVFYILSVAGVVHLLLSYPRFQPDEAGRNAIAGQLEEDFRSIIHSLSDVISNPHVLVSDLFTGESEVFMAANSLHHAMEYYDFRTEQPALILLNAEQQLHGAFVEDFQAYRMLSGRAMERMTAEDCDLSALSNAIADEILRNSAPSMESVHHHIQMFALTFTEQLSTSGLVDSAYMQARHIVRRFMGFETESQFRSVLQELIEDLHRQYRNLTSVGNRLLMQQVREYVIENIRDSSLSVNMLSDQFSVSPSQLTGQFRKYFDQTLYQFIQSTRLRCAEDLLAEHTDWSVREVSEAAGYIDISTMYRAFQKYTGTTPGMRKRSKSFSN